MKTEALLLIILSTIIFSGCDRVDEPTAEIRLQKLYPNCQIFEDPRTKNEFRVSAYIVKTQDGKIYYIKFFGGGMSDPIECFPETESRK